MKVNVSFTIEMPEEVRTIHEFDPDVFREIIQESVINFLVTSHSARADEYMLNFDSSKDPNGIQQLNEMVEYHRTWVKILSETTLNYSVEPESE